MRKLGTLLISFIPIWYFRKFLYSFFYGYKFNNSSKVGMFNILLGSSVILDSSFIGNFNIIKCNSLNMNNSSITSRNRIKNLNKLSLNNNSLIFKYNFIAGPKKSNEVPFNFDLQNLIIGENSSVLRGNYFDVVRPIQIGKNVVFGGEGSQIWTHGFDTKRTMSTGEVNFGNDIFIGSNCIFTKNVTINNNITIGPGSVIYKSIVESGFYTTHQIIKVR